MDLFLWRHAEAGADEAGGNDLARALTPRGEKQAERMAAWLDQRLPHSTRILVSPARRCQQTAAALGRRFKTLDELGTGAAPAALLLAARWPDGSDPVLLVGHQPTLGLAAALAFTGKAQPWPVKKGSVWWLRQRRRGDVAQVILQGVQAADGL